MDLFEPRINVSSRTDNRCTDVIRPTICRSFATRHLAMVVVVAALFTLGLSFSDTRMVRGDTSEAPASSTATRVQQGSLGLGDAFSCAVTSTGEVGCWGRNSYANLGDGTTTGRNTPGRVLAVGQTSGGTALGDISSISAGENFVCALTNGGEVRCWGQNNGGQMGDVTATDPQSVPVKVLATGASVGGAVLTGVKEISAGNWHICALMLDTTVKCWGSGTSGQLGDARNTSSSTPVDVVATGQGTGGTPLSDVAAISAGGSHTCALMNAGTMKCWGSNQQGNLGDNTTTQRSTPINVLGTGQTTGGSLLSDITAISAGPYMTTCAITATGGAKCWGYNWNGQLGDGSTNDRHTPVDVVSTGSTPISDIATITSGSSHTCATTLAGGVKCWGWNFYGQLGDGTTTQATRPVDVVATGQTSGGTPLGSIGAVSVGSSHTCALTNTGGVKCWGSNGQGHLGNGTYTSSTTPVDVASFASVTPDTTPPTVTVTRSGSGTVVSTDTITFTLSEAATDFLASDVTTGGGTLTGFSGSGASYTATFTPTPNAAGTATIDVATGMFTDAAGNNNTASTQLTIPFDTEAPTATITRVGSGTITTTDTIAFTLSESSTDFDSSDVRVVGGTLSGFTGSGTAYSATFTPSRDVASNATIDIDAGVFTDAAGNNNTASPRLTIPFDTTTTTTTTTSTTTPTSTPAPTTTPQLSDNSQSFVAETSSTTTSTTPSGISSKTKAKPTLGSATVSINGGEAVESKVISRRTDTRAIMTIRNSDNTLVSVALPKSEGRSLHDTTVGSTIRVTGKGYTPDTRVVISFGSSRIRLGSTTTSADGTFSTDLVLPTGVAPGPDILRIDGVAATGQHSTSLVINLTSPETDLPNTGSTSGDHLLWALWAVVAGGLIIRFRRLAASCA